MTNRSAEAKVASTRKVKKEQSASAPSTPKSDAQAGNSAKNGGVSVGSRLEKAILELKSLNELLLSGDLDPRVLANRRDALNRVRTAAWAAQQYAALKENC
jgi:hypothetical protein